MLISKQEGKIMRVWRVENMQAKELFGKEIAETYKSCDWINSCVVVADTQASAIMIADLLKLSLIKPTEMQYPDEYGITIKAVTNQANLT